MSINLVPITSLLELSESPNNNDIIPIVDVSDVTMGALGTSKFVKAKNLINKKVNEALLAGNGISTSYNATTGETTISNDDSYIASIMSGLGGITIESDPGFINIILNIESLTGEEILNTSDLMLFYDVSASSNKNINVGDFYSNVSLYMTGNANSWTNTQTFNGSGEVACLKHATPTTGNLYLGFKTSAGVSKGYVGFGSALNNDFTIANNETSETQIYAIGQTRFLIKTSGEINFNTTKVEILGTNPELNIGAFGGGHTAIIRLNGEALFSYKVSNNYLGIGSIDNALTAPIHIFPSSSSVSTIFRKDGTTDFLNTSGTVVSKIDTINNRISLFGTSGNIYKSDLVFGNYSSVGSLSSGAGFFMGTGLSSSPTANSLTKMGTDASHFFYTRYDRGLEFHTGISGSAGATIADTTNLRLRIDGNGNFIYPSNSSSSAVSKMTFRGSKVDIEPLISIIHDTDDGTTKTGGILTRTRMTNRYLLGLQNLGQNDTSVGNTGIITYSALEYSNSSYTTLVAPTEFSGWAFQYYNGSAYSNLLRIGISGVGIGSHSPTAKLDVNGDTIRLRMARTPASATAAGNAGDICWDSNYVYVCVATNTWKRSALSTW